VATRARTLRTDAARNREALLAAAEAEFADRGLAASVADIARRAGVAKATVFRHFASKEDLIVAIVTGHLQTLTAAATKLADEADPEAALLGFLTIAAEDRREFDVQFLLSASAGDATVADLGERLLSGIERLVDRARAAGVVREDVTATDVFLLMCAPIHVVENLADPAPELWRRYLTIIFDGLRPAGASPLPQPAPPRP
jgi:AcrR family transcriptional regulator